MRADLVCAPNRCSRRRARRRGWGRHRQVARVADARRVGGEQQDDAPLRHRVLRLDLVQLLRRPANTVPPMKVVVEHEPLLREGHHQRADDAGLELARDDGAGEQEPARRANLIVCGERRASPPVSDTGSTRRSCTCARGSCVWACPPAGARRPLPFLGVASGLRVAWAKTKWRAAALNDTHTPIEHAPAAESVATLYELRSRSSPSGFFPPTLIQCRGPSRLTTPPALDEVAARSSCRCSSTRHARRESGPNTSVHSWKGCLPFRMLGATGDGLRRW